jgi:hypothetical protein
MISKFLNRKRALDRKWLWPGWQMGRKCGRAAFATPRKGCALGRARWLRPRRGYRAVAAARARSTRSKAARRWHGTGNGERLADGGEEGGALARAGRSSGAEGRRTWGGPHDRGERRWRCGGAPGNGLARRQLRLRPVEAAARTRTDDGARSGSVGGGARLGWRLRARERRRQWSPG